MKKRSLRIAALLATVSIVAVLLMPPASADLPVIDISVLSQNVIEAARLLQQINNQLQSLQNEAMMLENMARDLASLNLSTLNQLVSPLQQISQLINQAQGIAFTVNAAESAFAQFYPQQYGNSTSIAQLLADARSRWQNSMSAFQQTLTAISALSISSPRPSSATSTAVSVCSPAMSLRSPRSLLASISRSPDSSGRSMVKRMSSPG
jgi:P-type conjugative transfer protein TrbJ